jgi:mRNA interferase MazF
LKTPQRGEVWLVDLGLAAKVRPCLVLSCPPDEADRALIALVPHTTSLRGSRYEVTIPVPFLRSGGFDAQNIVTVPAAKLLRILGKLTMAQLEEVETRVSVWLGLSPPGAPET